MGTDASEVVETLPDTYSFKVHHSMCTELKKLVDRVAKIFPEIEAARPRCSSGIQTLCLLNDAIDKAKQLLKYCCDSSKLYLAITGDVIVSRIEKLRNLLEQRLGQIQGMVPVMLAAEISRIIDDLRAAIFRLDSAEEGTGKAMRELLQHSTSAPDSVEYLEIKALQLAALSLHLTSPKAILLENRSIKKLLDKASGIDPTKKKILIYLLHLLKKYGNLIMQEQPENLNAQHEALFTIMDTSNDSLYSQSVEVNSHIECEQCEAQTNMLSRPILPEEFKCPISMRLMYDPVVIDSGQTFERMWIQKWFDEGNDTCPLTKAKLAHCSLTPNTAIKELISKWCAKYVITIPDPNMQAFQSSDTSYTSIASLGSSMNDLCLPLDISNISLGSLDASYNSDSSHTRVANGSCLKVMQKNDDFNGCQSYANMNVIGMEFLAGLSELHWEYQCKVVEGVHSQLQYNDQACRSLSPENFVEPLIRFLRNACDQQDVRAQRAGSQLLLAFVDKNRSGISYLHENAISLLSSLLDSEVIEEALAILEVLSGYPYCGSKISASGALVSILKILDSHSKEFVARAIKILVNLSSNHDICSQIVSVECIQKLVPFINDSDLARYCIVLLKNLCDTEEARVSVAETNGCIASIAELLESDNREYQEHAVAILLSLCSQRVHYCQLVMDEGVMITSLVHISLNGNEKGKAGAFELLRQLRDIKYDDEKECFKSDPDADREASHHSKEGKASSKTSGFFKNFPRFSKHASLVSKKKR